MRKCGLIIGVVAAVLLVGCGSRVDVSKPSASSSSTARPATSAPTTTAPFDQAAFCTTFRQIGLQNLAAFEVFEPTAAQAKLTLLDDLARQAPDQLDQPIANTRDALDEFLTKVTKGEISSKAQFDDWLLHLDLTRMQHYVDGEQVIVDYASANC